MIDKILEMMATWPPGGQGFFMVIVFAMFIGFFILFGLFVLDCLNIIFRTKDKDD